jgi:hypothetical protein
MRRGASRELELGGFCAVDEERAFAAKGGELGGVAEPASGICFRRGSGIDDAAMCDFGESGVAK